MIQPFGPRDLVVHIPHRADHELVRVRLEHKPTGVEAFGEAGTFEMANAMAETELRGLLRELQQAEGVWPRAAS